MVNLIKENKKIAHSLDNYALSIDSNIAKEILDRFGCKKGTNLTFIPLQEGVNGFSIKDFYEDEEKLNNFNNKNFIYISWSIKKSDYNIIYKNNIFNDKFNQNSNTDLKELINNSKQIDGFFITDAFNKFMYFVGYIFFSKDSDDNFIYSVPTFNLQEDSITETTVNQIKEDLQYQDNIDNNLFIIDAKKFDKDNGFYRSRVSIYGGEEEFKSILGLYNSMLTINWPILSMEKDEVFSEEKYCKLEKIFNNKTLVFENFLNRYNLTKEDFITKDENGNYRSSNKFEITGICDKSPVIRIYYMFGLCVTINEKVYYGSIPFITKK